MKRVIKCSFGLNDDSWLEPPEDTVEYEDMELELDLHPPVIINDYEFEPVDWSRFNTMDEETGIEVVSTDELEEIVYQAVEAYVTDEGRYEITGQVLVPYTVAKPIIPPRMWGRISEEDDSFNLELDVDYSNIKGYNIDVRPI